MREEEEEMQKKKKKGELESLLVSVSLTQTKSALEPTTKDGVDLRPLLLLLRAAPRGGGERDGGVAPFRSRRIIGASVSLPSSPLSLA